MRSSHDSVRKECEYQRAYPDGQYRKTEGPVDDMPVLPPRLLTQTLKFGIGLMIQHRVGDSFEFRAGGDTSPNHVEGNTIDGGKLLQVGDLSDTGAR